MPLPWHNELFQHLKERKFDEANEILKRDDIDINEVDENGMTVLMHLVKNVLYTSFTDNFIRTYAYASPSAPRKRLNMNATNKNGQDVFSLASAYNNISVMKALDIETKRRERLQKRQTVIGYHTTNWDSFNKITFDKSIGKYPMIGGTGGYFGGGIYFALTQQESMEKALSQGMCFECNLRMGEVLKISSMDELNEFIKLYCKEESRYRIPTDVMCRRLLTFGVKPYDSIWGHYDETIPSITDRILPTGDEYAVYYADQLEIKKTYFQQGNHWIPYPPNQSGGSKHYENLTVKELQERCAKRKIPYRGKRKDELIAALRKK
jgi:hypothetical protein